MGDFSRLLPLSSRGFGLSLNFYLMKVQYKNIKKYQSYLGYDVLVVERL